MSDVKYERGRTLKYPTMYPTLLITPVFAYKGDFMWIEKIVCKYDSDIDDIEEPEFEFVRSTVHSERNDALKAENAKLRELSENLLMAFVYLETEEEQKKCIDRAFELWHELDVLPMESFYDIAKAMRADGIEVDE